MKIDKLLNPAESSVSEEYSPNNVTCSQEASSTAGSISESASLPRIPEMDPGMTNHLSTMRFGLKRSLTFDNLREDRMINLQHPTPYRLTEMSNSSKSNAEKNRKFYKCEYENCGKVFIWPSHLKRHTLTHNNSESYICTVCGSSLSRKDNLKTHMRRIHKIAL